MDAALAALPLNVDFLTLLKQMKQFTKLKLWKEFSKQKINLNGQRNHLATASIPSSTYIRFYCVF